MDNFLFTAVAKTDTRIIVINAKSTENHISNGIEDVILADLTSGAVSLFFTLSLFISCFK